MTLVRSCSWCVVVAGMLALAQKATADDSTKPTDLLQRSGIVRAKSLLESEQAEERYRGIERLGALGTPRALALLAQVVEEPETEMRTKLVAARALAPHVRQESARQVLVQIMNGTGHESYDELGEVVRGTAALALAAARDPEAARALSQAIHAEGPAGEAAVAALLAHPPRDAAALLGGRGIQSPLWLDLFARLGDQHTFLAVRRAVTAGPVELRGRAAVALTRLGALETVALARHWQAHERQPPLRVAAAEILALTRDPAGPDAIAGLLTDEKLAERGLELALASPDVRLAAPLAALLPEADPTEARRLIGALGRCGGARAVAELSRLLSDARLGSAAAYALAQMEDEGARQAIEQALSRPPARRLAARAGVVRDRILGDPPRGLVLALRSLRDSSEDAERFVGAWGLATLESREQGRLLAAHDPLLLAAAIATSRSPDQARRFAARLDAAAGAGARARYAVALVFPEAAERVSTRVLLRLLEDGGAAAPLAARALAMRDGPRVRPLVVRQLTSGEISMRAHGALGLGYASDASAVGLLAEAYRFEPVARVRRAIVSALARRPERARRRHLELAARLDPDPEVRAVAQLGLAGQVVDQQLRGSGVLWLEVTPVAGEALPLGSVELSNGLEIPVAPGPDGLVVLTDIPAGPVRVRLAEQPARDEDDARSEETAR